MPLPVNSSDKDKKFFETDRPEDQVTLSGAEGRVETESISNPASDGSAPWSGFPNFYYKNSEEQLVDWEQFLPDFSLLNIPSMIPNVELAGGGVPTPETGGGRGLVESGSDGGLDLNTICSVGNLSTQPAAVATFCSGASCASACYDLENNNLGLNIFQGGVITRTEDTCAPSAGGGMNVTTEPEHVPGVLFGCDRDRLVVKWTQPNGDFNRCSIAVWDGPSSRGRTGPGCFTSTSLEEALDQCLCDGTRLVGPQAGTALANAWASTYGCEIPSQCPPRAR